MPAALNDDAVHEIAEFDSAQECVEKHMHNLCHHRG